MITQGISLSAKQAFLIGMHQPNDTYKLALYTRKAIIGPELERYTENGEVTSAGYPKGGIELKGFKNGIANKIAFLTFDDIRLDGVSFSAQGAIVYNSSKENAVLCTLNFGGERSVFDGVFELKFPAPENGALIQLS